MQCIPTIESKNSSSSQQECHNKLPMQSDGECCRGMSRTETEVLEGSRAANGPQCFTEQNSLSQTQITVDIAKQESMPDGRVNRNYISFPPMRSCFKGQSKEGIFAFHMQSNYPDI